MDDPATAVTSLDVAAQGRRAAGLDRRHDPALGRARPMARPIGGAVAAEDLRQLQAFACPRPCGRAAHRSGVREPQGVKRRAGHHQAALAQMKVAHCRLDRAVSHQPLDGMKIDAIL